MEPEYGTPSPGQDPLELLLVDIERALEHGLRVLALHGALAIPDICSAAETDTPGGKNQRPRYIDWFDRYMPSRYTEVRHSPPSRVRPGLPATFQILAGKAVYGLRCKMLHEHQTRHENHDCKIYFSPFESHLTIMVNGNHRYHYVNPDRFCVDLIGSARQWSHATDGDPDVQRRKGAWIKLFLEGAPVGEGPLIG